MKKVFIGVDVSKEKLDATIIEKTEGQHVVAGYETFDNSKDGIRKLSGWVRKTTKTAKEECLYCAETTGGYDRLLCEQLYAKGHTVWRESALEIKRSSGLRRGKDDKTDSKAIAEYAMRHADKAEPYRPTDRKIEELRELYLYRDSLVEERKVKVTRAKEIKATCASSPSANFMYKTSMEDAKRIESRIRECEKRINRLIASDENLARNYGHVTSVKGISLVNGVALLVYTGNFTRFDNPNKLATYYGVAPFRNRSGSSVDSRADVRCYSNRKLKGQLSQAALIAVLYNPTLKAYYDRLIAAGKPRSVVLNNVKNKLLHILFSLVVHDCDYEENHEWKRKLGNDGIEKTVAVSGATT
jgi:transposase